ncbi:uncharacterized protein LOC122702044 [Cervus elaphus]|uniref:uncharacterized protein LOC122702044 n=1 Tax=Cervus elaphus TaxID=9860 RepID=UPI001CC2E887|nr:uncharacterized protein LOC122702044 [Cervus elaphus]
MVVAAILGFARRSLMGRLSASCSREEVTSRASRQGPGSGGLCPAPGAPRLPTSPEARLLERAPWSAGSSLKRGVRWLLINILERPRRRAAGPGLFPCLDPVRPSRRPPSLSQTGEPAGKQVQHWRQPEGRGTGLHSNALHPPTSRQCALFIRTATSGQPPGLWWGQPPKGEAFTDTHSHTHSYTHTHTLTVPPGIHPEPVTRQQTGTWKMPEAEGLETSLRNTHPGSFSSFLEFLKSQVKGPRPPGRAQKNFSAPLGGGNAAWEWRGSRAAFRPRLPRPQPQPRGAPGSASENKALRFQPKVKVHRERVFFPSPPPPPESKSDSVSPNKPPINQPGAAC